MPIRALLFFLLDVLCIGILLYSLYRFGLPQDVPFSSLFYKTIPAGTDPRSGWLFPKNHPGLSFWLHEMPKDISVAFGVLCLLALGLSFIKPHFRLYRRQLFALVISLALVSSAAAILKQQTQRYCPGQLAVFNGPVPMEDLSRHTLPGLPKPACWPAAHAAAGYGLLALAFLPGFCRRGIAIGLAVGSTYGLIQIARGEHFLSHILATLLIAVLVQHFLWLILFRRKGCP